MYTYYTHNHLNLCHKHFVIASKITIFRIKASFVVLYSFTWQFKAKKGATITCNVFIVCFRAISAEVMLAVYKLHRSQKVLVCQLILWYLRIN